MTEMIEVTKMYQVIGEVLGDVSNPKAVGEALYKVLGQDGVEVWADTVGFDRAWCVPCEWLMPVWAGDCLVCGTPTAKEDKA